MSSASLAKVTETLRSENDRVGTLLESLDAADWERPTRCAPLTFRELVAHMLRGAERINQMIDDGPLDEQPAADAITYWRVVGAVPNAPQPAGPSVVQSAQEKTSGRTPGQLIEAWRADWSRALSRALDVRPPDPVLRNPYVTIRLGDFVVVRHVEVVVHHMDLCDALGRGPDPDPGALGVVCGVLAGMLGTDPVAMGMDPVRFALAGTGRETLNAAERDLLGPLADSMPLIV